MKSAGFDGGAQALDSFAQQIHGLAQRKKVGAAANRAYVCGWAGLISGRNPLPLHVNLKPTMQNGLCRPLWSQCCLCSLVSHESHLSQPGSVCATLSAVDLT